MPDLAVNVDHIATIREARKTDEPSPVEAALQVQSAGANGIVVHLRQDRRHIQEYDLNYIMNQISLPVNLEMSATADLINIALLYLPHTVTLVPEKSEEVTTEGGLDLLQNRDYLKSTIRQLKTRIPEISLFINPDPESIKMAAAIGANGIELHTGRFADAQTSYLQNIELERLQLGADLGAQLGLKVRAGHGLTYRNVHSISLIQAVSELSIGHSIVSRAVLVGMERAVLEMLELINPR